MNTLEIISRLLFFILSIDFCFRPPISFIPTFVRLFDSFSCFCDRMRFHWKRFGRLLSNVFFYFHNFFVRFSIPYTLTELCNIFNPNLQYSFFYSILFYSILMLFSTLYANLADYNPEKKSMIVRRMRRLACEMK